MEPENPLQLFALLFDARSVSVVSALGDPSKFRYMTLDSVIRRGYKGRGAFRSSGVQIYRPGAGTTGAAINSRTGRFVPAVLREAA